MTIAYDPTHFYRKPTPAEDPDKTRWVEALHHAAHGVVGQILAVPYAEIVLGCTHDGHIDIHAANRHVIERLDNTPDGGWSSVRLVVMFIMAGCAAEWSLKPDKPATNTADTIAAMTAVGIYADCPISTLMEIVETTIILVRANWECIEHVARALIARGRLASEDIAHLIHGLTVTPLDVAVEGAHSN